MPLHYEKKCLKLLRYLLNKICHKKRMLYSIAALEELNMNRALFVLSGVTDLERDHKYTFFLCLLPFRK